MLLAVKQRPGWRIMMISNTSQKSIILQAKIPSIRVFVICLISAAVGLPIGFVSLAKLLLVLTALVCLIKPAPVLQPYPVFFHSITVRLILASLCAMAVSILWSTAPHTDAYSSVAKYGKLLVIALLPALIRSRREGLLALLVFVAAQTLVLVSSWMLFLHLPTPWALASTAHTQYAVFSSYLDQGIMGAVLAAVCWHLRSLMPQRWQQIAAVLIAAAAVLNVLFVLDGRSGHIVMIALLSLAIMWALPKRYRLLVVLLPFVMGTGIYFGSMKVHQRANLIVSEMTSYQNNSNKITSTGIRLSFWTQAINIIRDRPWIGAGVGSWSTEFNRLQRAQNHAHVDIAANGNPHQEYLLWAVQLGVPGLLLFCTLFVAMLDDSRRLETPFRRAFQSVLAAFAIACLFNASLYDALIGDFFCVLFGLLFAFTVARSDPLAPSIQTQPQTSQ